MKHLYHRIKIQSCWYHNMLSLLIQNQKEKQKGPPGLPWLQAHGSWESCSTWLKKHLAAELWGNMATWKNIFEEGRPLCCWRDISDRSKEPHKKQHSPKNKTFRTWGEVGRNGSQSMGWRFKSRGCRFVFCPSRCGEQSPATSGERQSRGGRASGKGFRLERREILFRDFFFFGILRFGILLLSSLLLFVGSFLLVFLCFFTLFSVGKICK